VITLRCRRYSCVGKELHNVILNTRLRRILPLVGLGQKVILSFLPQPSKQGNRRHYTSPPVPPPAELDETSCLILAHWPHHVKT